MNKNPPVKEFDFSQYIVLQPRQGRNCGKRIYAVQGNELHLNGNLMATIDLEKTHYVRVFLHEKENKIALQLLAEKTVDAVYLGTNGHIKLRDITEKLKARGIKCPVCFTAGGQTYSDTWEASCDPTYCFPEYSQTDKKKKKEKKNAPKEMLPENE